MDEFTLKAHEGRSLFAPENDTRGGEHAFVKLLLEDLSRDIASGSLIVVPGLNGLSADEIVGALDTIYTTLARLCMEPAK